jgi:hypothetical protein
MWNVRQLDRDALLVKLHGFELEATRVRGELHGWWTIWAWFRRVVVGRC